MKRRKSALWLGLLLAAPLVAEEEWIHRDVRIPMRDKAELTATLFLPKEDAKLPAVLVQTPYGRQHFQPSQVMDSRDYAYLVVDWRGRNGSGGAGARLPGGEKRSEDCFDTVEWAASQPWCDGKVGTWGPSALGGVQILTAQAQPPHLVCCVPMVTSLSWSYRTFYPGGALRLEYAETIQALGFTTMKLIRDHPYDDLVWKTVEASRKTERIQVPMLFIGGWYDLYTEGVIDAWREVHEKGDAKARAEHRLLIGPWTHMNVDKEVQGECKVPAGAGEARRQVERWFDRWLRGKEAQAAAEVRYFQVGEDAWKDARAWPPEGYANRVWYLAADGKLSADAPKEEAAADEWTSDPAKPVQTIGGANLNPAIKAGPCDQAPLLARQDVRSYSSAELEADVVVAGQPKAFVWLASDRPDVDVAVRLCDVGPDGRTMLVADATCRASLREGFRAPKWLAPGEPVEVPVSLAPVAVTFARGHRIRIVVSETNAPRYEPNPHTGAAGGDPVSAKVSLRREASHRSRLVLPVSK